MAPRKYIDLSADHDPAPLRGGPGVAGRMSLSGSGAAAAAAPDPPRKRQRLVTHSTETTDDHDLTEALASGLAQESDDDDVVVTHVRTAADRTMEAKAQAIALDAEEPSAAAAPAVDFQRAAATATTRASNDQQPASRPPTRTRRSATPARGKQKRQRKEDPIKFNVALTGVDATRGPVLIQGMHADTRGVTLLVVDGEIKSNGTFLADIVAQGREDEATRVIFSVMKTNIADARLALGWAKHHGTTEPNHKPMGSGPGQSNLRAQRDTNPTARFQILDAGVWLEFAAEHSAEHKERLINFVRDKTVVTWEDILLTMYTAQGGVGRNKTLVMRSKLFAIVPGPKLVLPSAIGAGAVVYDIARMLGITCPTTTYEIDGRLLAIPNPDGIHLTPALAKTRAGVVPGTVGATMASFTQGELRSEMQKVSRYRAARVTPFKLDPADPITGQDAAKILVWALCSKPCCLDTNLGKMVRGDASALKRTAVIAMEDAWVRGGEEKVAALVLLAWALARLPQYQPPLQVFDACASFLSATVESDIVISWHRHWQRDRITTQRETMSVTKHAADAMGIVADVLPLVGSFAGDIEMARIIADMYKTGKVDVCRAVEPPGDMPITHMEDGHNQRGVGHIGPIHGKSFQERLKSIFGNHTSFNPRLQRYVEDAHCAEYVQIQQIAYAAGRIRRPARRAPLRTVSVPCAIPSGALSMAIGPLYHRKHLVVVDDDGTTMHVVAKPSRDSQELNTNVSDKDRAAAIKAACKQKFAALRSPDLPGEAHRVEFQPSIGWTVDGLPWTQYREQNTSVTVSLLPAPSWVTLDRTARLIDYNKALADAVTFDGDGIVDGASRVIKRLVDEVGTDVALRAVGFLRRSGTTMRLPTPDVRGEHGADQEKCFPGDWNVYRLLALLSRLVPGAMTPGRVPAFTITSRALVRYCIECIESVTLNGTPNGHEGWESSAWAAMGRVDEELLPQQLSAVNDMRQRYANGYRKHMFVMDTGAGKTGAGLTVAYESAVKENALYIIWVAPKSAVVDIAKQLRDKWHVPVHEVPRVSRAAQLPPGCTRVVRMRPFHINVVVSDDLKFARDDFVKLAPLSVGVWDEVDEMYAQNTQRTSIGKEMAILLRALVAQTATPYRKNPVELIEWLRMTDDSTITLRNWLAALVRVAVVKSVKNGIARKYTLHRIRGDKAVYNTLKGLLSRRSWEAGFIVAQAAVDEEMIKIAIAQAKRCREQYPNSGAVVVANNENHAVRLMAIAARLRPPFSVGDFESLMAADNGRDGIVIIPKYKNRGYNNANWYGAMVSGAYPTNASSLQQLEGRLPRHGQRFRTVEYHTVVLEDSLLDLLYQRQRAGQGMNATISGFGDAFGEDALRMLRARE